MDIKVKYKVMWYKPPTAEWPFWPVWETDETDIYVFTNIRARGDGGRLYTVAIHAQPTTDSYTRCHGISVDTPLPSPPNWWEGENKKRYVFKVTRNPFIHVEEVLMDYYVEYSNSGFVPDYAWYVKIYIDGVLKAEGTVGRNQPLRAYISS